MPNYKIHLLFGVLISILAFFILKFYNLFVASDLRFLYYLPIIFLYSLLPDIDSKHSIIRKIVLVILIKIIILLAFFYYKTNILFYLFYLIFLVIVIIIISFLSHRNIMHSILACLLLSLPLLIIDFTLFLLSGIAFLSHLIIDGEFKIY